MLGERDTIAAIGTAQGVGALSIVRLSGLNTQTILQRCFSSAQLNLQESHRAFYGFWVDPETREAIDEVLVLNFSEGKGFTGEDAVDVICHGGVQVTELVLEAALTAGARMARPGEFTYRAVMHNKIDLARAEGVLELIQANSPRAAAAALKNIRGGLSRAVTAIETEVIFILANLEASIDFTTEDIQPVEMSQMAFRVQEARHQLAHLTESYVKTKSLKQGLRVVLVGQPNAGKSSLLNALTGKRRSIVADLPGTTRDTVEEDMLVDGVLIRLVDTAGLRLNADVIESEGVQRARDEILVADLVLYVVDAAATLNNLDFQELNNVGSKRALICFNKTDVKRIDANDDKRRFGLDTYKHVSTSTLEASGADELRSTLKELVKSISLGETASVVSTHRQKELIDRAEAHLSKAQTLLGEEASPEFVSFELKESLMSLQEVLGKAAGDDVMDRVFREFCIGK